jgi:acyl-CoA reductase-like NAD-dependent aldehyde dehydrogenase
VLASRSVAHPAFENARVRTPLIVQVDAADRQRYGCEQFGPIAYVVATGSTQESLELATTMAREQGAITFVVYSTDRDVLVEAERLATDAGVSVAENLTGSLLVNQSAAYSDFHVSGANPAGNASLSDAAFVVNRFRVVQTRSHVAANGGSAAATS